MRAIVCPTTLWRSQNSQKSTISRLSRTDCASRVADISWRIYLVGPLEGKNIPQGRPRGKTALCGSLAMRESDFLKRSLQVHRLVLFLRDPNAALYKITTEGPKLFGRHELQKQIPLNDRPVNDAQMISQT